MANLHPSPHRGVCLNLIYIIVTTLKNEAAGSRGLSTSHHNTRRHIAEKLICKRYSHYLESGIPVKSHSGIRHRLRSVQTNDEVQRHKYVYFKTNNIFLDPERTVSGPTD